MPFFMRNKSAVSKTNKKKNIVKNGSMKNGFKVNKLKSKNTELDEEILSDEIEDSDIDIDNEIDENNLKRKKTEQNKPVDSSEDENETAQEKKIRLAKKYLSELQQSEAFEKEDDDDEEAQIHRSNLISTHLKESVLEKMGKLHRTVAEHYSLDSIDKRIILKNGHRKIITAMVISNDGQFVFTAGKDCNLVKWSIHGKRLKTIFGDHRQKPETFTKGHTGEIRALAISTDFKYLASGCIHKIIHIWCPDKMVHIHTFQGHRSPITGLVFRRSFHQLFSCSEDRMVKVWNLDEMCYVESLLGHHDSITAIDSFVRDRCITAGGRDGTIRIWKIPEESNLIFLSGSMVTIDCVKFIDESHFISAADDGSISLWSALKKKPLYTIRSSHGSGYWITSLASMKNTDLFVSGSHNGFIQFWRIKAEFKGFEQLFQYNVEGFVNALEFSQDGKYLVAAISQEHRLGRWFDRLKNSANVVHIIPLIHNLN